MKSNQDKLKRTPVPLTDEDKATLTAAARRHGISTLGDYLRFAGLYVARGSAPVQITRNDGGQGND
jgi:hypothetical protein